MCNSRRANPYLSSNSVLTKHPVLYLRLNMDLFILLMALATGHNHHSFCPCQLLDGKTNRMNLYTHDPLTPSRYTAANCQPLSSPVLWSEKKNAHTTPCHHGSPIWWHPQPRTTTNLHSVHFFLDVTRKTSVRYSLSMEPQAKNDNLLFNSTPWWERTAWIFYLMTPTTKDDYTPLFSSSFPWCDEGKACSILLQRGSSNSLYLTRAIITILYSIRLLGGRESRGSSHSQCSQYPATKSVHRFRSSLMWWERTLSYALPAWIFLIIVLAMSNDSNLLCQLFNEGKGPNWSFDSWNSQRPATRSVHQFNSCLIE